MEIKTQSIGGQFGLSGTTGGKALSARQRPSESPAVPSVLGRIEHSSARAPRAKSSHELPKPSVWSLTATETFAARPKTPAVCRLQIRIRLQSLKIRHRR